MTRVNKSWMALVAAALLLGTLVGVVWARPNGRPGAADITRKVTLTAGDFIPADDARDWYNFGTYVECSTGNCVFTAPVVFPCLPSVTVERFKLHADDNNGGQQAVATLFRSRPSTGSNAYFGVAASPPATGAGLETYTSSEINKVVWPSQRAYLWLVIGGPDIDVYGVTVEYHRNI
jgi:hypothetical protein